MTLAPLRLQKQEHRRLRAGHLWIYSNEVDTAATPLSAFEPGQRVVIEDHSGRPLGTGYVNPHALICARLVSRDPQYVLDRSLLVHRLNIALSLRERLFDRPYYRLCYGEADQLPGLVVDRYGDVVVAQLNSAGMEQVKAEVIDALQRVLKPGAILLRNDSSIRKMEGLPDYVETAHGTLPEHVIIEENGLRFKVPLQAGQKTGWFYDQRMNRLRLRDYVKGMRVLDLFSYMGGFGINAAAAGAREVLCVDSAVPAPEWITRNAALNDVPIRVRAERGDALETLQQLRAARDHYDVVILDPPAFIKRRKDHKEGLLAYQRLNQAAMQVLTKDGILVSCSCSYHLAREELHEMIVKTGRHVDRFSAIVEEGRQGPDHPVHPAIPEMAYLKAAFVRVLPE